MDVDAERAIQREAVERIIRRRSTVEQDRDRVLARARELFPADVAERWYRGSAEPFLNGASPESAVESGHADDVLAALAAIQAGSLP